MLRSAHRFQTESESNSQKNGLFPSHFGLQTMNIEYETYFLHFIFRHSAQFPSHILGLSPSLFRWFALYWYDWIPTLCENSKTKKCKCPLSWVKYAPNHMNIRFGHYTRFLGGCVPFARDHECNNRERNSSIGSWNEISIKISLNSVLRLCDWNSSYNFCYLLLFSSFL